MITVAHRTPRAMVSTHMSTTPAATSRAETSFTGLGNEKRARTRLDVLDGGAVRAHDLAPSRIV